MPAGARAATEAGAVPRCGVPPPAGRGPAWPGCWPAAAPAPAPAPGEAAPVPLHRENARGVSAGPAVLGPSFTCPPGATPPLTPSQAAPGDTTNTHPHSIVQHWAKRWGDSSDQIKQTPGPCCWGAHRRGWGEGIRQITGITIQAGGRKRLWKGRAGAVSEGAGGRAP